MLFRFTRVLFILKRIFYINLLAFLYIKSFCFLVRHQHIWVPRHQFIMKITIFSNKRSNIEHTHRTGRTSNIERRTRTCSFATALIISNNVVFFNNFGKSLDICCTCRRVVDYIITYACPKVYIYGA